MRVVIQRVKKAEVKEKRKLKAKIGRGVLLYLAVAKGDTIEDIHALIAKLIKLRIFAQKEKKHDFQLSIKDIKGEILVIPNYTLYCDVSGGNRPYFGDAARPEDAKKLYKKFLTKLKKSYNEKRIKTGTFGEFMEISLVNDGPVTIILETAFLGEDEDLDNGNDSVSSEPSESFNDFLGKLGVDLDV